MARKNPAAVALGRIGGRSTSDVKRSAARRNLAIARAAMKSTKKGLTRSKRLE